MEYQSIFFQNLGLIIGLLTILWLISVWLKNASIVDMFWGFGFVVSVGFYFYQSNPDNIRSLVVMILAAIWGMRLSGYLTWRNWGKGEDYRYQQFRQNYGPQRYWWVSYFQVFLLQGVLIGIISAPLLSAIYFTQNPIGWIDYLALTIWIIGFFFETAGDLQLVAHKANPENKGKLLTSGVWKYTRHPNYFGDAAVWWGFALFSVASGSYWPILSSLLMTLFLVKVSGVSLLEKTLKTTKPGYEEYMRRTNSFIPWFPKKK